MPDRPDNSDRDQKIGEALARFTPDRPVPDPSGRTGPAVGAPSKKAIDTLIDEDPARAASVVRRWLRQDG